MRAVLYNKTTGQVTGVLTTSAKSFEEADSTEDTNTGLFVNATAGYHNYIDVTADPVTLETRAELSANFDALTVTAAGSGYITLATLPIPCTVYVDGVATIVNDGSFEFDADAVGEYKIVVDEPTFARKEWIVNAN